MAVARSSVSSDMIGQDRSHQVGCREKDLITGKGVATCTNASNQESSAIDSRSRAD
jgi:hypothetical protein